MTREKFRTVVTALVSYNGRVLIGKKEEDEEHPIGGKWHILGGHLEHGEELEEAVRREVKEETGLDVEVHQLVDAMAFSWKEDDPENCLRFVYHVESESGDAEAMDDLEEVKWVQPEKLDKELCKKDSERIMKRSRMKNFVKKLEKMPSI